MKRSRRQIDNREESRFCDRCGQKISATPSEKITAILFPKDKLSRIQKYLSRGLGEKVLARRDKLEGKANKSLSCSVIRNIKVYGTISGSAECISPYSH